jgi:hypothetical protein
MVGTTTALILGMTAMAGASAAGGIAQSRAAGKGANAQVKATEEGRKIMDAAVAGANPAITEAAAGAGAGYNEAATGAAEGVINAGKAAAAGVTGAAGTANAGVNAATGSANDLLNPYIDAGRRGTEGLEGLANGPGFKFNPDEDPRFQFQLEQGMNALTRNASARGASQSGGAWKAAQRYATGLAGDSFDAAFDRFRADRSDRAGMYSTLSGNGLTASGRAGDNLVGAARYSGDNDMDAATYAGNVGLQSEQYAGDARRDAAKFGVGLKYDAAVQTGNNSIRGAEFGANTTMAAGDARAAEGIAKGNAFAQAAGGVANAGSTLILGSALRPRTPSYNNPISASAYLPGGILAPARPQYQA